MALGRPTKTSSKGDWFRTVMGAQNTPFADVQESSPFAQLKPIQVVPTGGTSKSPAFVRTSQEIFPESRQKSRAGRVYTSVPTKLYKSDAPSVPTYVTYTGMQRNVLVESNRELLVLPYFSDDAYDDRAKAELWNDIDAAFIRKDEDRFDRLDKSNLRSKYTQYIETFLQENGLDWEDILRFFLKIDDPDRLNRPFDIKIKTARGRQIPFESRREKEERRKETEKRVWKEVALSLLQNYSDDKIEHSWSASVAFYLVHGTSLWDFAKHTQSAEKLMRNEKPGVGDTAPVEKPEPAYRDLACRICHM